MKIWEFLDIWKVTKITIQLAISSGWPVRDAGARKIKYMEKKTVAS